MKSSQKRPIVDEGESPHNPTSCDNKRRRRSLGQKGALGAGSTKDPPPSPQGSCTLKNPETDQGTNQTTSNPKGPLRKGGAGSNPLTLRLFTLNVWGLRTSGKIEDLLNFLVEYQVHVGVITETHLLKPDAMNTIIPGYTVLDADGKYTHKGGVMIIADNKISHRSIPENLTRRGREISTCSCLIYPTHSVASVIRVTGVYIPPSADATPDMVQFLTAPHNQVQTQNGEYINHLIVGDFNQHTWKGKTDDLFHEWVGDSGMWELSDPTIPTHRKGSALDKFLLVPGTNIPDEWLPTQSHDWIGEECAEGLSEDQWNRRGVEQPPFYPAHTFGHQIIADHHPVMLRLVGTLEEAPKENKAYKLKDLTAEEWASINYQLSEFLQSNTSFFDECTSRINTTRYLRKLITGIREALGEHYKRNTSATAPLTPFEIFCKKHLSDPEYPLLIRSHIEGNDLLKRRTITNMVRRQWRTYLSKVRPSNVSALFSYLAKQEGRKPRSDRFSCAGPLLDSQETLRFKGIEKCTLLADFFERRFSAPELIESVEKFEQYHTTKGPVTTGGQNPLLGKITPSGELPTKGPLNIFRKPTEGVFTAFTVTEIAKAVSSLATKKAPGPDGLVAELFRNLPALLTPVTVLFNMIMVGGRFPQSMVQLYLIFLDKPHKPQEKCASKRPISLISILSKTLEAAILNRLMESLEDKLTIYQYAYRRDRGTEHLLLDLTDFLQDQRAQACHTYLASIDVDGAFDTVPHRDLIRTLTELGVNDFICRYIAEWLNRRVFHGTTALVLHMVSNFSFLSMRTISHVYWHISISPH